ncbi:bifunctional tRNA (5-methylaminomethyl-2-thiouridine)(34)-methyltransferase MnmD/FAD-dependent 5-carboxymethylaminomethyl-2-thiouridine(34) oxidoreductase MnmC [Leptospira yasudae]|uniref:bifunctional tRNA (5-methylaminomethyl-2-thiouridine)(34)-methyltransferase MnmD/FAD-dependent 5-carboxymethylaminomethyl-2-thiouridine(34) oxidoreductase MnmC n=1 Tax=Leptospira yasudae TaxID=2202201 RepID=UPI00108410DA|nr:bifunctional tRNA (5-methylaminomethyl-2-thiouridine)(34)-methyltransferase MnmD/FAD-dependent 5-carboxymethylaminomethyl-2-thiouridine(34) oxidoreductase MnmC [Leptospira yasudae]TGK26283.1 bifunctional tRNA (5-methylaminomethyl-2-thiouridine)(34)-methyltransferase MnmD/FAD-dependent 5-carboxymethylaminomethyl-2-thiouridine(34) oxidoreductase MnmC [Leptospira yasudae]TGM08472.1 bifunctional tRNA (5-methylaminomethyl-2-thiouridine)(34)-methyltransferase MnmD/FAD-dependent 5-carboxymethylaminom
MLSWKENLTPVSSEFDDIYFSPENGLKETEHVFIQGNDLPERWKNSNIQNSFSILELGFGTGLNFFTTWKEYLEHEDRFRLHFLSIEKFPLRKEEIAKALSVFPELKEIADEFLNSYQDLIPGMNYFRFSKGRIHLNLFLGDVTDALRETSGKADAIFLDGFAPSKNPEMWQIETLQNLKNVCKIGTTVSTFTVARMVRDSLSAVGFTLEKRPGFGRKREMLTGKIEEDTFNHSNILPNDPGTAELIPQEKPWCVRNYPKTKIETAAIIGAGIAGSALAYSLSQRGIQVTLIDPSGIANEASGIPSAISHPHLTKIPGAISSFTLRAFRYAIQFLSSFANENEFKPCGLFHGVTEEMNSDRFRNGIANHRLSEEIVSWVSKLQDQPNVETDDPTKIRSAPLTEDIGEGVFFPKGFWTQPGAIAKKCAEQPGVEFIQAAVTEVIRSTPTSPGDSEHSSWKLKLQNNDREVHADSIIFCNSHSIGELLAPLFDGEEPFPIKKVRGQLLVLKETKTSSEMKHILCAEHYLTPSIHGEHVLGSTFDEFDLDRRPRSKDTEQLLEYLRNKYPSLKWNQDSVLSERVGFRAQTPDRFPILGPVFDPRAFVETYKEIELPRNRSKKYPRLEPIPGLYVFGGLGSRGILSSFLGAEILASLILGEPAPVESSLLESLHPARFLYRKVRK